MRKQILTEQNDSNIQEVMRLLAEIPERIEELYAELSQEPLHELEHLLDLETKLKE